MFIIILTEYVDYYTDHKAQHICVMQSGVLFSMGDLPFLYEHYTCDLLLLLRTNKITVTWIKLL